MTQRPDDHKTLQFTSPRKSIDHFACRQAQGDSVSLERDTSESIKGKKKMKEERKWTHKGEKG